MLVKMEWVVRVVRLAEPSRGGATVDQLSHGRKSQMTLGCAKLPIVMLVKMEWVVRVVRLAEPSRGGATADQLNHERKNLIGSSVLEV
jgi:hypothetical protein